MACTERRDNDSMSRPTFKVGEVSTLLGMPNQTIRYFDKEGVVVPFSDPRTGHRMYSVYDIYKISMRRQYKNLGISVADTKDILNGNDIEAIKDKLAISARELAREKLLTELRCESLDIFRERIQRIPQNLYRYTFRPRPARWHHLHMRDRQLVNSPNCTEARRIAMDFMPLSVYTFRFSKEQCDLYFSKERPTTVPPHLEWDVTFDSPYAERVGFDKIDTAFYVPEVQGCVYTVFKQLETCYLDIEQLRPAMTHLKEHNLLLNGDVCGNIIINYSNDQGENERFFEAWLPVEKQVAIS